MKRKMKKKIPAGIRWETECQLERETVSSQTPGAHPGPPDPEVRNPARLRLPQPASRSSPVFNCNPSVASQTPSPQPWGPLHSSSLFTPRKPCYWTPCASYHCLEMGAQKAFSVPSLFMKEWNRSSEVVAADGSREVLLNVSRGTDWG